MKKKIFIISACLIAIYVSSRWNQKEQGAKNVKKVTNNTLDHISDPKER